MRTALALATVLLASGCDVPPAPAPLRQPILQGTPDPDGDPSVVFLEGREGGGTFSCTGTVVAPHVVLTAAHCVQPEEGPMLERMRIYLGAVQGPTNVMDTRNWVTAVSTAYNPDFNLDGALSHDAGVIITAEPLPRDPIPLMLEPLVDGDRGKALRLVGFGIHKKGDDLSYGSRYQTTAVIKNFGADLIIYQGNAQSICSGDSGGPALFDVGGTERLAGIHSFGYGGCLGLANDTRVDTNLYWIASQIEAADPGFLPMQRWSTPDMGTVDPGAGGDGGCALTGRRSTAGAAAVLACFLVLALATPLRRAARAPRRRSQR